MRKKVINGMFVLMACISINTVSASSIENPLEIEVVYDWKEYLTVEYKYQVFESGVFRNQSLILFRFTNSSSQTKSITWVTKEFRNEICTNCERLDDDEYLRTVTLSPGQTLEGKAEEASKTEEYLFSHFVKLVPGMSNQRLTDFEFVNVNVSTL